MENIITANLPHRSHWFGWRRWTIWGLCIGAVFLLGSVHSVTPNDLALYSLAVFPVLVIAWFGGKSDGFRMAVIAAIMWPVSDFIAGRDLSGSWVPWVNVTIRLTTYFAVAYLAATVHALLESEHARATHDALTDLQNRRAFLEAGMAEVGRSKRYGHPLAVVFLDLDHFKQLNDERGHEVGDQALKATAAAILSASRSTDLVARLGGDEFAILIPEIRYSAAVSTGRKIHAAVTHALASLPPVSASVGVAWFERVDRSFSGMLTAADEVMYEVKKSGKNGILAKRLSRTGAPDSQV